jgi:hypothetical protein
MRKVNAFNLNSKIQDFREAENYVCEDEEVIEYQDNLGDVESQRHRGFGLLQ